MIIHKGKVIETIKHGNRNIVAVFKGKRLVWQSIHSCFGGGYWANKKPWLNGDGWKN